MDIIIGQYKDHLGNIRLSYSDLDLNGAVDSSEILEENNYYPGGLKHKGYNNVINGAENNHQTYQGQELEEELGKNTLAYQWRDYDLAIARFNKIDRFAEKYISHSPYAFVQNNPIRNREIDGRHFDKKNEKRAKRLEKKIDKKIKRLNKQVAKLQKKGKNIGDRNDRIGELRDSKTDITDMRDNAKTEFRFKKVGKDGKPGTTQKGDVVTMAYNSTGTQVHESRHGGQNARGELNNVTGANYGVADEVSAYRAQYSYDGVFRYNSHNFDQTTPFNRTLLNSQIAPPGITRTINSINNINATMVRDVGEFHTDTRTPSLGTFILPVYSIYSTYFNNN